jgi:hypothetical protein
LVIGFFDDSAELMTQLFGLCAEVFTIQDKPAELLDSAHGFAGTIKICVYYPVSSFFHTGDYNTCHPAKTIFILKNK